VPALAIAATRSPALTRVVWILSAVVAGLLALAGVAVFLGHLVQDPLVDTRAYWDAGRRLNEGLPLYDPAATTSTGLYLYPPLLAILFRPLALLPFPVAAAIWMGILIASLAVTIRRIGRSRWAWIALGCLGIPVGWALAIGQAEPLVTALLTLGAPWSVAFAGHLKIAPWLVAIFWLGRRDWRALGTFAAWVIAIGVVQLILEPRATIAYLRLEWVGPAFGVRNFSPYVIHPLLWVALVLLLVGAALWQARRPAGWPLAVLLAVFAYPRLLVYQLLSLLAAFGGPPEPDAIAESRVLPEAGNG
jgi:hypothetical protein